MTNYIMFTYNMELWLYVIFLLLKTTVQQNVPSENFGKVPSGMIENLKRGSTENVMVAFGSPTKIIDGVRKHRSTGAPGEKAELLHRNLLSLANSEQAGVMSIILSSKKKYRFERMWLTNRIYIEGADFELLKQIGVSPNVTSIGGDLLGFIIEHPWFWVGEEVAWPSYGHNNVTEGLELIQVPQAWEVLGGKCKAGEGVVVGVLDTGAFVEHETLVENFVGKDYGYFDTDPDSAFPWSLAHGTHVTGTIVGRNGIGVAPAAKFAHCRACNYYGCESRAVEKCLEFFICPTLQDGTKPDCSKRVHVINLTIGDAVHDYYPYFEAAIATGIILVAPMGIIGGYECSKGSVPGLLDDVIAVGAVELSDELFHYTSKGPNPNPKGNPKPDVVAPAAACISANYKNEEHEQSKYRMMSGVSSAVPHVTGLIALLLTRDKELSQAQARKLLIQNTDRPLPNVWGCDNKTQNSWPNPEFGYGRINALKAINAQTTLLARKGK